jgi:hypothetical protein
MKRKASRSTARVGVYLTMDLRMYLTMYLREYPRICLRV